MRQGARNRRARWIARSLCPLIVLGLVWAAGARADGDGDGYGAFKAGRYHEALEAFRQAAEARPRSAEAAANVGATLSRLGRNEQAVKQLEHALELSPEPRVEAAIRYDLGTAQLAMGTYDEAIENLESALRLDPSNREAKINLEIALRRRPPPPPGSGDSGQGDGPPPPPAPPQPSGASAANGRMTRDQAERLLDAIERRERLEFPRGGRRPAADPSVPDW